MHPPIVPLLASCALVALSLSACGGGGGSAPAAVATPGFTLKSSSSWQPTNITLTQGESVTVAASGTFNNGQCGTATTCDYGPDGEAWSFCANLPPPAFLAPGLPCYSLIGKVGADGAPFEVGANTTFSAPAGGVLYLGINDNFFSDNKGTFSVLVTPS